MQQKLFTNSNNIILASKKKAIDTQIKIKEAVSKKTD